MTAIDASPEVAMAIARQLRTWLLVANPSAKIYFPEETTAHSTPGVEAIPNR